jgi:hypothetical protein
VFIKDVPYIVPIEKWEKNRESIQAVPEMKVMLPYEIGAHKSNDFSRAGRALRKSASSKTCTL